MKNRLAWLAEQIEHLSLSADSHTEMALLQSLSDEYWRLKAALAGEQGGEGR